MNTNNIIIRAWNAKNFAEDLSKEEFQQIREEGILPVNVPPLKIKKAKDPLPFIKKFCSTDETRQPLGYIYTVDGETVATNGTIMISVSGQIFPDGAIPSRNTLPALESDAPTFNFKQVLAKIGTDERIFTITPEMGAAIKALATRFKRSDIRNGQIFTIFGKHGIALSKIWTVLEVVYNLFGVVDVPIAFYGDSPVEVAHIKMENVHIVFVTAEFGTGGSHQESLPFFADKYKGYIDDSGGIKVYEEENKGHGISTSPVTSERCFWVEMPDGYEYMFKNGKSFIKLESLAQMDELVLAINAEIEKQ